jgi:hypothetical protein
MHQAARTKRPHRTRQELETALLAFELVARCIWLALSVALAVVAALCALHGSPWPVPAGTGFAAVGFRVLSEGHRGRGL